MQKAGLNVSCMTPSVTNKSSSKESIKIIGYKKEDGLNKGLLNEYGKITRRHFDQW